MAELEYEDEGFREMVLEIMAETKEQATVALQAAGFHLQTAIVEKLSGRRTGHIYPVPGTRTATYQASAPGEPPAVMLGNLRNFINVSAVEESGDELSVAVGPDIQRVPYAARLEFGGRDSRGGYIAPRPYLRPAFAEQEQNIENIIRSELAR